MNIKKFNKISVGIFVIMFMFMFMFMFGFSLNTFAATTPSLGVASTFSILSSTFTRNIAVTAITGDLGYTTLSGGGSHTVTAGTTHVGDATYTQAGIDQGSALSVGLAPQACTFTFAPGPINLATDATHGTIGVYQPGVYCTSGSGAASIGTAGIVLNGTGTFIFRVNGALTTVNNSNVTVANGASSCNVFWTPTAATTLGANTTFLGTVIDDSGITVGNNTLWNGRALAFGGTVTTDTDTISSACTSAPAINGGMGLVVSPLISVLKVPSPLALPLGPGAVTYNYSVYNIGTLAMSNITVADDKCSTIGFVSGDLNSNSMLDTNEIWNYRCTTTLLQTTTNTVTATGQANGITAVDTASATVVVGVSVVPPLIHIVKRPNLFVVPVGGAVTYMYTVTNPGTAPLSNVTVTDDKCTGLPGRVYGHPGDINKNDLLESNEAWSFTCETNLFQTTTNTGTAKGSANGLIATDYALATVVVTPPNFPTTGFPPQEKSAPLTNIVFSSVFMGLLFFYIVVKKESY